MLQTDLRQQVADCVRITEKLGLTDFSGHVSARADEETYWINSRNAPRSSLTVGDIVRVDLDGNLIEGDSSPPSETAIHGELYRARAEVHSVGHLHTPIVIEMSIARVDIVPVIYHGAIFEEGVPVYDDCRHVNTPERGRAVAQTLGQRRAMIIRGHGAVLVAEDVVQLLMTAVYLAENAERQYHAMLVGEAQTLSPEELEEGKGFLRNRFFGEKQWKYYVEKCL
jgi:ribulose-5-phosphate 4-epimerase/fuculose-1-phosphate aldolase